MKLKLNKCRLTGAPILTVDSERGGVCYTVAGSSGNCCEIRDVEEGEVPANLRPRIQDQVARAIREHPDLRGEAEAFLDRLYRAVCLRDTWRHFKGAGR